MLYAVRASKAYWHGRNKPEMLASWGTKPTYVSTRKAAVKFWFKSSARKLIAETHRAHREGQSFKIEGPIAALFEKYFKG